MEQLILEKSGKIDDVISKLFYRTQTLSSFIMKDDGNVTNFEQIGAIIADDPVILNVLIAPGGVVSDVYPLEGNEAVVGLNFFAEGAGNREAIMAKETGQLVLGGPFNAIQGGQIMVGRLPVFLDREDGAKLFWGLVSVTLRYPQALDGAGLNELKLLGFDYELWRVSPDNNERQIIADSGHSYDSNTDYIEKQISIRNADWYFRILPVRMWYQFHETWISILASIGVSLLIAIITQNYHDLKKLKDRTEEQNEIIMAGIIYAEQLIEPLNACLVISNKIQNDLLPTDDVLVNAFSDHSVIWKPRDIVGGDIYWMKNFEQGSVLCVCECTGHGTPGALLTMLVVSALEGVVQPSNCHDTADIIWRLEQRLVSIFSVDVEERDNRIQDGCDLAVLFIAKDGSVNFSSGNIHVFVCDGSEVQQIKGQKIYVGEGRLNGRDDIKTVYVPANPRNKFYIASDGLFEQPGGERSEPYGYKAFKQIILENHDEKQSVISDKIWAAFEEYRGAEPRVDDFELITFKPQAL